MMKLILCLICGLGVSISMLEMRQTELELKHKAARIQEQIELQYARLWSQQLQIATETAPSALARSTLRDDLDLTPAIHLDGPAANWMQPPSPTAKDTKRRGL